MRGLWIVALTGLALLALPPQGRAQFVIPDINKDTLSRIPPPSASQRTIQQAPASGGTDARATTTVEPATPDPRCARLPPSLRQTTPGCK